MSSPTGAIAGAPPIVQQQTTGRPGPLDGRRSGTNHEQKEEDEEEEEEEECFPLQCEQSLTKLPTSMLALLALCIPFFFQSIDVVRAARNCCPTGSITGSVTFSPGEFPDRDLFQYINPGCNIGPSAVVTFTNSPTDELFVIETLTIRIKGSTFTSSRLIFTTSESESMSITISDNTFTSTSTSGTPLIYINSIAGYWKSFSVVDNQFTGATTISSNWKPFDIRITTKTIYFSVPITITGNTIAEGGGVSSALIQLTHYISSIGTYSMTALVASNTIQNKSSSAPFVLRVAPHIASSFRANKDSQIIVTVRSEMISWAMDIEASQLTVSNNTFPTPLAITYGGHLANLPFTFEQNTVASNVTVNFEFYTLTQESVFRQNTFTEALVIQTLTAITGTGSNADFPLITIDGNTFNNPQIGTAVVLKESAGTNTYDAPYFLQLNLKNNRMTSNANAAKSFSKFNLPKTPMCLFSESNTAWNGVRCGDIRSAPSPTEQCFDYESIRFLNVSCLPTRAQTPTTSVTHPDTASAQPTSSMSLLRTITATPAATHTKGKTLTVTASKSVHYSASNSLLHTRTVTPSNTPLSTPSRSEITSNRSETPSISCNPSRTLSNSPHPSTFSPQPSRTSIHTPTRSPSGTARITRTATDPPTATKSSSLTPEPTVTLKGTPKTLTDSSSLFLTILPTPTRSAVRTSSRSQVSNMTYSMMESSTKTEQTNATMTTSLSSKNTISPSSVSVSTAPTNSRGSDNRSSSTTALSQSRLPINQTNTGGDGDGDQGNAVGAGGVTANADTAASDRFVPALALAAAVILLTMWVAMHVWVAAQDNNSCPVSSPATSPLPPASAGLFGLQLLALGFAVPCGGGVGSRWLLRLLVAPVDVGGGPSGLFGRLAGSAVLLVGGWTILFFAAVAFTLWRKRGIVKPPPIFVFGAALGLLELLLPGIVHEACLLLYGHGAVVTMGERVAGALVLVGCLLVAIVVFLILPARAVQRRMNRRQDHRSHPTSSGNRNRGLEATIVITADTTHTTALQPDPGSFTDSSPMPAPHVVGGPNQKQRDTLSTPPAVGCAARWTTKAERSAIFCVESSGTGGHRCAAAAAVVSRLAAPWWVPEEDQQTEPPRKEDVAGEARTAPSACWVSATAMAARPGRQWAASFLASHGLLATCAAAVASAAGFGPTTPSRCEAAIAVVGVVCLAHALVVGLFVRGLRTTAANILVPAQSAFAGVAVLAQLSPLSRPAPAILAVLAIAAALLTAVAATVTTVVAESIIRQNSCMQPLSRAGNGNTSREEMRLVASAPHSPHCPDIVVTSTDAGGRQEEQRENDDNEAAGEEMDEAPFPDYRVMVTRPPLDEWPPENEAAAPTPVVIVASPPQEQAPTAPETPSGRPRRASGLLAVRSSMTSRSNPSPRSRSGSCCSQSSTGPEVRPPWR